MHPAPVRGGPQGLVGSGWRGHLPPAPDPTTGPATPPVDFARLHAVGL